MTNPFPIPPPPSDKAVARYIAVVFNAATVSQETAVSHMTAAEALAPDATFVSVVDQTIVHPVTMQPAAVRTLILWFAAHVELARLDRLYDAVHALTEQDAFYSTMGEILNDRSQLN